MNTTQRIELLIVLLYFAGITIGKSVYLNKKYDVKKSNFIYDCLNGVLVPCFILIQQYELAIIWGIMFIAKMYQFIRDRKK